MSFQIFSIDNSEYFIKVLPLFRGNKFSSAELSTQLSSLDLSVHPRRSRHLLQIWYVLGFLDRVKRGGAYIYFLSEFGEILLNHLQFNQSLALELAHWAWYSAWLRSPDFERAWSWLYQQICDLLWETSPKEINVKHVTALAIENASKLYPSQAQALDNASIGAVLSWLAALDPPFAIKQQPDSVKSSMKSHRRDHCSPELMYLSIQLQYHIRAIDFGTPLLIDDQIIVDSSKTCLMQSEQFWPMVEISSLTFATLQRKETAYGTSLIVVEAAPFTSPVPRWTGATSR